jgi:hypothetical protein
MFQAFSLNSPLPHHPGLRLGYAVPPFQGKDQ